MRAESVQAFGLYAAPIEVNTPEKCADYCCTPVDCHNIPKACVPCEKYSTCCYDPTPECLKMADDAPECIMDPYCCQCARTLAHPPPLPSRALSLAATSSPHPPLWCVGHTCRYAKCPVPPINGPGLDTCTTWNFNPNNPDELSPEPCWTGVPIGGNVTKGWDGGSSSLPFPPNPHPSSIFGSGAGHRHQPKDTIPQGPKIPTSPSSGGPGGVIQDREYP